MRTIAILGAGGAVAGVVIALVMQTPGAPDWPVGGIGGAVAFVCFAAGGELMSRLVGKPIGWAIGGTMGFAIGVALWLTCTVPPNAERFALRLGAFSGGIGGAIGGCILGAASLVRDLRSGRCKTKAGAMGTLFAMFVSVVVTGCLMIGAALCGSSALAR